MPIFLLAVSQAENLNITTTLLSFAIIHLLIYPASNGYNSYIDKDTTSIGGIEKPPMPTKQLFYITLCLDVLAILLSSILVNYYFSITIFLYILASRAYSSKQIRLKKYPIVGFLTVVIFQGGFTYVMSTIGITNALFNFTTTNYLILGACSLQIAGAYPLTQIYQHQADLKDGVKTLSYSLGYIGTFAFTALMFVFCNLLYYCYFNQIKSINSFFILQFCFIPIIGYFAWWFIQVYKSPVEANFKNTMRMNVLAACCMNTCFLILIFLK